MCEDMLNSYVYRHIGIITNNVAQISDDPVKQQILSRVVDRARCYLGRSCPIFLIVAADCCARTYDHRFRRAYGL